MLRLTKNGRRFLRPANQPEELRPLLPRSSCCFLLIDRQSSTFHFRLLCSSLHPLVGENGSLPSAPPSHQRGGGSSLLRRAANPYGIYGGGRRSDRKNSSSCSYSSSSFSHHSCSNRNRHSNSSYHHEHQHQQHLGLFRKQHLSQKSQLFSPVLGCRYFSADNQAQPAESSIDKVEAVEDTYLSEEYLKPKEVVEQLNRYIIGQNEAKRSVAIALRGRWRRHRLSKDMKDEVMPKNILMVGPTGCGKTEVARRLAKLADAPFLKVEATKFTEIGFHGKDVDSIIRDLVEVSIIQTKARRKRKVEKQVRDLVNARLLDLLIDASADERSKREFEKLLLDGEMENQTVDMDVPVKSYPDNSVMGSHGQNYLVAEIQKFMGSKKEMHKRTLTVAECRPILEEMESDKLLSMEDIFKEAIKSAEEDGIVFIDEIDKICSPQHKIHSSADASAEGVQRDLLPLIEGCQINLKYGNVNTDHILFIASGAFHSVKPSDLMAELQGRLPIRVTLNGLAVEDLYRILKEPEYNLIQQQVELLQTEGVKLVFEDNAIMEIAKCAAEVNKTVENIGARRLQTVVERVIEEVSFDAPDKKGEDFVVTKVYVKEKVSDLLESTDLSKFIF